MPETRRVFVAWDGTIAGLRDPLRRLRDQPDRGRTGDEPCLSVVVPMLDDDAGGEVWRDVVAEQIENADALLAFLDRPNANVAYEVGFALGRGIDVYLAHRGAERPHWTRAEPFRAQVLRRLVSANEMRCLLRGGSGPAIPRPTPPSRGDRSVLLCPAARHADDPREVLADHAERVGPVFNPDGLGFTDFECALDGAARVLWLILAYPEGDDERDGQENAALAAVAGFLRGCDREVVVLRQRNARAVVDVELDEHEWRIEEIAGLLAALSPEPAQCRGGDPSAAPVDALGVWRKHLRKWNQQLVPFFGSEASRELGEIWVERELAPERGAEAPAWGDAEVAEGMRRSTLAACIEEHAATHAGTGGLWLVLGTPGSGKTTLLRRLCSEMAADDAGPVPVLLSLAHVAETRRLPFELAEDDLEGAGPGLAAELARLAQDGRVWFLLDGLDEVRPRDLLGLPARLRSVHEVFRRCPLVVTSRDEGRRDLGLPFQALRLLDLQDPARLFERWLPGRGAAVWAQVARHATLRALARNAWMATLMAKIAAEGDELPRRRADLFERAITLLLERGTAEDAAEDGAAASAHRRGVADADTAADLLRPLALRLQRDGGEAWTRSLLNRHVRRCCQDAALPHYEADLRTVYGIPRAFLDDVGAHSGLLAPRRGPTQPWEFVHRSLREYLAATAWAERPVLDGERRGYLDLVDELVRRVESEQQAGDGDGDEDASEQIVSQWGETLVLLAGALQDATACRELLAGMQRLPGGLMLRALPGVQALSREDALGFLLEADDWSGDDLLLLLQGWREQGLSAEDVAVLVSGQLGTSLDLETAARFLYAIEEADLPITVPAFFETWGRSLVLDPAVLGIEMAPIPGGTFVMGSAEDEQERVITEGPVHEVTVAPFELARHTVTEGQVAQLMGSAQTKDGDRPFVEVSYYGARLICRWLGGRLPSESEWEYACRAGTTTPFHTGEHLTTDQANDDGSYPYAGAPKGKDRARTVPVASFAPNGFGLYQMHGNVWEWCEDTWHDSYKGAPDDGSPWIDEGSDSRVIRGGSWNLTAWYCHSACRNGCHAGLRLVFLGFRPARSLT